MSTSERSDYTAGHLYAELPADPVDGYLIDLWEVAARDEAPTLRHTRLIYIADATWSEALGRWLPGYANRRAPGLCGMPFHDEWMVVVDGTFIDRLEGWVGVKAELLRRSIAYCRRTHALAALAALKDAITARLEPHPSDVPPAAVVPVSQAHPCALGHADALAFFSAFYRGACRVPSSVRPCANGVWSVEHDGALDCAFTGDTLTRLVLLAHEYGVRVSVQPRDGLRVAIVIGQLASGAPLPSDSSTIEQAAADFRASKTDHQREDAWAFAILEQRREPKGA